MTALTEPQRRALAIVAAHPGLHRGVRCSRVSDETRPSVHTDAARGLARLGLVELHGIGPYARLTADGVRVAATIQDQDALCASEA